MPTERLTLNVDTLTNLAGALDGQQTERVVKMFRDRMAREIRQTVIKDTRRAVPVRTGRLRKNLKVTVRRNSVGIPRPTPYWHLVTVSGGQSLPQYMDEKLRRVVDEAAPRILSEIIEEVLADVR